jgi:crotonobetainyl-CoA:carnitine CoA-transferase CaiB-like acyl-CoA transferase
MARALCECVLEMPALGADARFASNAARSAARDELQAITDEVFTKLGTAQAMRSLDDAGIANAQVNEVAQVWDHAQLRARQRRVQVDTPAGAVPAALPPGAASADEVHMGPVPALGQHSAAILAELGYADAAIAEFTRCASA